MKNMPNQGSSKGQQQPAHVPGIGNSNASFDEGPEVPVDPENPRRIKPYSETEGVKPLEKANPK